MLIEKLNRRFKSVYSQIVLQLIADSIGILLSYFIQFYIRFYSGLIHSSVEPDIAFAFIGGLLFLSYFLVLFFFTGQYRNWHVRSPFDELWSVTKATFIGCALLVFLVMYNSAGSPRLLFFVYVIVMFFSIVIGRTITRRIQIQLRDKRIVFIPSIIIGSAKNIIEFYRKTLKYHSWGYKVDALIVFDKNDLDFLNSQLNEEEKSQLKYIAEYKNFNSIIDELNPEELIITTDNPIHKKLLEIVSVCTDKKIQANIEPDLYDIFTGQTRAQNIYGVPLIEIRTQLLKPWQSAIKRIFDIVFSALVIILGFPFWFILAIAVKFDSPGPIFFLQDRVGKDGRVFRMVKFRSMKVNSEKGEGWTSVNDPRVTKFGKFIRKTHLDEIPQFWNVFKGDMSVVGPRPEQKKLVDEFSIELPHYKRRLIVRPGITGWWQVKYQAYSLTFEELESRLKDDFYYIENMSIQLDLEIVFRTVWCVLRGHGQA